MWKPLLWIAVAPLCLACASGAPLPPAPATQGGEGGAAPMTDAEYREEAARGMHDALLSDVEAMATAAADIQRAAPADHGWDPALDKDAIAAMRAAWVRGRAAYERVEGALAPLFPVIDVAIDARYDDFMTLLAAEGGDKYLFDGAGVTGMHAIERIIYADAIPPRVIDFERTLPGYVPAAFPKTAAEAADFKSKLCGRFRDDVESLHKQWSPANIAVEIAFQGLISLVKEQREKVQKAASNEEESRYSQRTMADLQDNLAGTKRIYALFQPWILAKGGAATDAKIEDGMAKLDAAYGAVSSAAIPAPPPTWSAEAPSPSDLQTPFGRLYTAVEGAVDPAMEDSMVSQMNDAAALLGFPVFPGAK